MINRKGIDINKANERLGQFLKEHKHPIFESVNPIDENGNRVSQEEAIDITDTFQPLSHFILFPRHPAHADITVMRLIARHLCDLVLIPHNSVVSRDYILYWNFTRNLILRGKRQKEDFRLFSGERENLLGDFNTMVEVASIPWRLNSVEDTLVEEIQDRPNSTLRGKIKKVQTFIDVEDPDEYEEGDLVDVTITDLNESAAHAVPTERFGG